MKIHQLRNATMVLETADHKILIDPMLSKKSVAPPFTLFRFKPRKNPIVDLPANSDSLLQGITHCLITHKHPDHIDRVAEKFLREQNIPVTCSQLDEKLFRKKGLNVVQTLDYWQPQGFLGGEITGIPARHGYGFIAGPMGNVMGFHIALPDNPSVYLSSDTIYTSQVKKALSELKPDIAVVASGTAQLDFGQPLLMRVDDIVHFAKDAPGRVICNHLEAVNHCPTTRTGLQARFDNEGLTEKTFIPADGETLTF